MGKYTDEALRMLPPIQKGIQSLENEDALLIKTIYPKWRDLVKLGSVKYDTKGYKFVYENAGDIELYECVNPNPTFQEDWVPGINTASLYLRIDEKNEGTLGNPKIAARGMKYTYGLYYLDPEDNLTYLCKREGATEGDTVELAYLPHELLYHYFVLA